MIFDVNDAPPFWSAIAVETAKDEDRARREFGALLSTDQWASESVTFEPVNLPPQMPYAVAQPFSGMFPKIVARSLAVVAEVENPISVSCAVTCFP